MDILNRLSSQAGDRSGNHKVAAQCLEDQTLITEIIAGLEDKDNKIVVDCAEVLTEVAKLQPGWVVPYGHLFPRLLNNKNNRARWEGMHCLALIAEWIPEVILPILNQLNQIIVSDKSVIVRDYAIDTIGSYAKASEEAARTAFPLLERSLKIWEGKHAQHALEGLCNVVAAMPELKPQVQAIALEYANHNRGTVKKSARKLLRLVKSE
jgi:hypothetical protein